MSLARVVSIVVQSFGNQLAVTPPNPTQEKLRYHTDEPFILRMAPTMFKIHHVATWLFTLFETAVYLSTKFPTVLPPQLTCPTSPSPSLRATPAFYSGIALVLAGAAIRTTCFRHLGSLFTFDLTVHPSHRLITSGPYSIVRHPAYTGSLLLIGGLALTHLTPHGWLAECAGMSEAGGYSVLGAWWVWAVAVVISRALAEDGQMRELFGKEWETWAGKVRWWLCPGIV